MAVLFPSAGGGLANVVEDTTPELGGHLDALGYQIHNTTGETADADSYSTGFTLAHNGADVLAITGLWFFKAADTDDPIADGSYAGQTLLVVLAGAVFLTDWSIPDSGNCSLNGDFVPPYTATAPNGYLLLRWSGSAWVELDRYMSVGTSASGTAASATGSGTDASGNYSNARNNATTASGLYANADGDGTTASGSASYARGKNTTAGHSYGDAEGQQSETWRNSQHVFSDAYNNTEISQGSRLPISRKTTSATAAELTIGGVTPSATSRVVIPANMALNIDIQVLAIEDGAANCAKWDLECLVLNSGGTMSIAGPSGAQAPDRTLGSPGSWTVELKVDDTNDSFVVEVVGEAATNIHWRAILRCAEAQYA